MVDHSLQVKKRGKFVLVRPVEVRRQFPYKVLNFNSGEVAVRGTLVGVRKEKVRSLKKVALGIPPPHHPTTPPPHHPTTPPHPTTLHTPLPHHLLFFSSKKMDNQAPNFDTMATSLSNAIIGLQATIAGLNGASTEICNIKKLADDIECLGRLIENQLDRAYVTSLTPIKLRLTQVLTKQ